MARAHNARVRLLTVERSMAEARRDYQNALLKLRMGHGLSIRVIGKAMGVTPDHIRRQTAAYADPDYEAGQRKRVTAQARKRGRFARENRNLAGKKVAPDEAPDLVRTERRLRELSGG